MSMKIEPEFCSSTSIRRMDTQKDMIALKRICFTVTREAMYVKRNMDGPSWNHCCCGQYYVFYICVCSFRYQARKEHAPYYIAIRPVWLYHIFPRYFPNNMIFGQKLLSIKCMLWFSLQLPSENLLIRSRYEWNSIKNVDRSSREVSVIVARF
jgi:hypothetical protein